MSSDRTQIQDDEESRRAQELSRRPAHPPAELPGYDPVRFLGAGAYGEVWVAVDRNTGRHVAIKFYAHRGGLDWSLLSREVEKLVFLSADRYVVQLLEVGWNADPPYYVMEYIEQGSLDDRLRRDGPMAAPTAITLFREVAIGLAHAHGKGVLHCDLKPANVLLDQDARPRLADFGQSRLSHEQTPALGTLFFMAPEQAHAQAVPDARWDVYALGALVYTMLTGVPPHRTEKTIEAMETASSQHERLERYRTLIAESPLAADHRSVPGVDRALAEVIDRCLAVDPEDRYPNVQAGIDALDEREARRARRPLLVLGLIGPAMLMIVMGLATWRGVDTAINQSDDALTERALESSQFAAQYVAKAAAGELERRFHRVEEVAADREIQAALVVLLADPELQDLRARLNDPQFNPNLPDTEISDEAVAARQQYRQHEARQALQRQLDALMESDLPVASWFFNDPQGLQLARTPQDESPRYNTIGRNYARRTYFHGGPSDLADDWRPEPGQHVLETTLSRTFRSQATTRWIVCTSAPIYNAADDEFLGVINLSVEVGNFVDLLSSREQFAVLVDAREGQSQGRILQHPLFEKLIREQSELPDIYVSPEDLPTEHEASASYKNYRDSVADDPTGEDYGGTWLASASPITIRNQPSGLFVLVQEKHGYAIEPILQQLSGSLLTIGAIALAGMAVVLIVLWGVVAWVIGGSAHRHHATPGGSGVHAAAETMATISDVSKN